MSADRHFFKSILTLLTGATLAQALPLLAAPLLTRMYAPDDFGLFAFYSGLMSNLAVVATARYELAIVLPKEENDAAHLLGLSLIVSILWAFVLLPISLLFGNQIAHVLGHPEISMWLPLLALSVMLAGFSQAFTNWANRQRQDRLLASSRFVQSGGMVGVQVTGGLLKFGEEGLILGQVAGQVLSTFMLGWKHLITGFASLRHLSWHRMKQLALEYKAFPTINSMHAFVTAGQETGALWLLAHYGNHAALGFYGLTIRVLKTPVGLVGSVVGQVLYQRMAETKHQQKPLLPLFRKILLLLTGVAIIPTLILLIGGEWLFIKVFGVRWAEAGRYAQWLSPYMLLYFVASPLASLPLVIGKQKSSFSFAVVGIFSYLFGMWLGVAVLPSVESGLAVVSIAMCIYFFIYLAWMWRAIATSDKQLEMGHHD
ncbi:oligosaccharide flippase family protein [Leeia sp. TBRC 13508]|uniref:Oligosaccharide flippase family protein n=1 Tax=Leeia speluncae TaxID=2884804 RepID=A0ABS8D1V0_9NEIS|nr:oligosaccharide flippase family protein [Leeia speluncae]MCB6182157.1 oligosaccharide flippase family protein [Leeia speluncae]